MNKLLLEERLVNFSVSVLNVSEELNGTKGANHLSGQVVRSSTSSALNYGEAQSAESQKDFVHKMKVCLKELRETSVCLKIIAKARLHETPEVILPILKENNELIAIFVASIKTASGKLNQHS